MKKAFTLIELLVVVLIIGILAAAALPSYRRAAEKSKMAAILPLLKSISDAQARYFLANDGYAASFSDLDIVMPEGGTLSNHSNNDADNTSREILTYPGFVCYLRTVDPPSRPSAYCNTKYAVIEKYYHVSYFFCWADKNNQEKNDFCKSVSGKTAPDASNTGSNAYYF